MESLREYSTLRYREQTPRIETAYRRTRLVYIFYYEILVTEIHLTECRAIATGADRKHSYPTAFLRVS